jgi:hypothetical protein
VPALERLPVTRVVATPSALDALALPAHLMLRTAPDELLIQPPVPSEALALADTHALVIEDCGFAGIWLDAAHAQAFLEAACEWAPPTGRPAFAQGAVAGVATRLYFEDQRVLLLIPAPMMHDFADALARFAAVEPTKNLS